MRAGSDAEARSCSDPADPGDSGQSVAYEKLLHRRQEEHAAEALRRLAAARAAAPAPRWAPWLQHCSVEGSRDFLALRNIMWRPRLWFAPTP